MADGLRLLIVGTVIAFGSAVGLVTELAIHAGAVDTALYTTTDVHGSRHTVTPAPMGGTTAFAPCSHGPARTDVVNCNRYPNQYSVWLSGGPTHTTVIFATTGTYYFEVTDPTGKTVLSTDTQGNRTFTVSTQGQRITYPGNHGWDRTNGRLQVAPFSSSKNGEYKLAVCNLTGRKTTTCNYDNFKFEVTVKASPSLTTAAASATLGQPIHDTAALADGDTPSGHITFDVYSTGSCQTLMSTERVTVHGNATYTSPGVTPSNTGTYFWLARYSGDTRNTPATTSCGTEAEVSSVTTEKAKPIITTSAVSAPLGSAIHDTATLAGGDAPTGTVTFGLYSTRSCHTRVSAGATSVNGDGTYASPGVTPPSDGTYYWLATYSGDGRNQTVTTSCGTEAEISIVSSTPDKGSPSISTRANSSTYPTAVHDEAIVTGGTSPSGTITFDVYSTARCRTLVTSVAKTFDGAGSYLSPDVVPPGAGTFYWTASAPASTTDNAMISPCGAANEASTVTKKTTPPNPSTPKPTLAVTKSSTPPSGSTVARLTTVVYRLTLTNTGDAAATSVTVTDTVPSGTTYKATSASCGNAPTGCAVSESATTVTWTGLSVQPGTSNAVTVSFAVVVKSTDGNGQVITDSAVFTNEGAPGCGSAATCVTNTVTVVVVVRTTAPTTSGPPKPTPPVGPTRIPGSTTVHTGQPWAGSLWGELGILAVGLGLLALGALLRRRGRSMPVGP